MREQVDESLRSAGRCAAVGLHHFGALEAVVFLDFRTSDDLDQLSAHFIGVVYLDSAAVGLALRGYVFGLKCVRAEENRFALSDGLQEAVTTLGDKSATNKRRNSRSIYVGQLAHCVEDQNVRRPRSVSAL